MLCKNLPYIRWNRHFYWRKKLNNQKNISLLMQLFYAYFSLLLLQNLFLKSVLNFLLSYKRRFLSFWLNDQMFTFSLPYCSLSLEIYFDTSEANSLHNRSTMKISMKNQSHTDIDILFCTRIMNLLKCMKIYKKLSEKFRSIVKLLWRWIVQI